MVTYAKKEMVGITELGKSLGSYLDKVISDPFNKIAVIRHNKPEAVIIPVDEYERIIAMSEAYENEQISKVVENRVHNREMPAKMISQDDMLSILSERINCVQS